MRKQRRQPSFATLTDAEIEQIAQSLDGAIYADIRARVNKPRSEGGYGLNLTTDRPLELLWKRTKTVEKINTHITRGEKLTLATFEQITAGDSDPGSNQGEHPATDEGEIHDAILFETMEAVRSGGNSPHQLLALQRLADFPARAELRAAKEQRAEEMHRHKTTLDLRKFDHKFEISEFQKQITTERLKLAGQKLKLREEQLKCAALSPKTNSSRVKPSPYPPGEDALGPLPKSLDDHEAISARVRKHFGITPEEAARRAALQKKFDSGELKLPQHCGMPDPQPTPSADSTESTIQPDPTSAVADPHSISPSTDSALIPAVELPDATAPSSNGGKSSKSPPSISRDAMNYDDATTSIQDHGRGAFHPCPTSISHDAIIPTNATPADPNATDVEESETQNQKLKIQNSASAEAVAEAVDRYTIARVREYIAHNQKYTPWPHRHSPPEYITALRHCPCGHATPCPTHETIPDAGPFPPIFWKLSPLSDAYAASLRDRNLPHRHPREFLP